MKNMIVITTLAVMACSPALAATMASQPWVTNRIAEAEARVGAQIVAATNAIPAPGNYAVVSNRAMSALLSHQPLTPATNYTDSAVSALGSVFRDTIAEFARASTNYTDAVAAEFENGTREVDYASDANTAFYLAGDDDTYNANDLIRESTNAAIAVSASKQDALPYPTNAIPFSAIDGAPSCGQEWRVEELESQYDTVFFVTNGMVKVEVSDVLIPRIIGWPEGAAMFVQGRVVGEYTPVQQLRLVGYGTWPTNDFQSVWWRSGTNIYVNVILEE